MKTIKQYKKEIEREIENYKKKKEFEYAFMSEIKLEAIKKCEKINEELKKEIKSQLGWVQSKGKVKLHIAEKIIDEIINSPKENNFHWGNVPGDDQYSPADIQALEEMNRTQELIEEALEKQKQQYESKIKFLENELTRIGVEFYEELKQQKQNFKNKLDELISLMKDGCGKETIIDEQEFYCGDDFQYKEQVKVVLCDFCLERIEKLNKIFSEELDDEN